MKIIKILSTLLIILTITGSQFVTTLASQFISLESASQALTVPYRAFTSLIAVLIILLTFKNEVKLHKVNKILYIYWALLIIRFIYDVYFRSDVLVDASRVNQLWLFFVCSTIIPMYAITKSFQYVNTKWLFYGTFILCIITAVLIVNSVEGYLDVDELEEEEERLSSNVAMGSILTGYFGLLVLILSVHSFRTFKKFWIRILSIAVFTVGVLLLFRSGSRGPVFAAVGVIFICLISVKQKPIVTFLGILTLCLVFVFWDYITIAISNFAPNLYVRLTRDEGLLNDRIPIFNIAINSFTQNPIFGHDFAIYGRGVGGMSYAHNLFLDTIMQLGIVGLIMMAYIVYSVFKLVRQNIRYENSLLWLNLFLLMKFLMLQLSSAFYLDSSVSIIIVYLFQQQQYSNQICTQNKTPQMLKAGLIR